MKMQKEQNGTATPAVIGNSMVFRHPGTDPYDPTNVHGFNHAPSIVLLQDGRLLAAWFSGPYEGSVHQVILGAFSSDHGKTWSKASLLQDFRGKSDFDPAFINVDRRTLMFFSAGRHTRYPFVPDEPNNVGVKSFTTWARYTDDAGRTWSDPAVVRPHVFCRSNGIRLLSGELLLPVYESPSNNGGVLRSADEGKTWQFIGGISCPAGAGEPTIAETPSDGILMMLRTRDGFLWQTRSRDRGITWDPPAQLSLKAATSSHHLLRLRDGRLALTHNESPASFRTNLTLRLSIDGGKSWQAPVKLADAVAPRPGEAAWAREVSYPSATELADGTLVVVWTAITISDVEQYGDIHAAVVRVPVRTDTEKESRA